MGGGGGQGLERWAARWLRASWLADTGRNAGESNSYGGAGWRLTRPRRRGGVTSLLLDVDIARSKLSPGGVLGAPPIIAVSLLGDSGHWRAAGGNVVYSSSSSSSSSSSTGFRVLLWAVGGSMGGKGGKGGKGSKRGGGAWPEFGAWQAEKRGWRVAWIGAAGAPGTLGGRTRRHGAGGKWLYPEVTADGRVPRGHFLHLDLPPLHPGARHAAAATAAAAAAAAAAAGAAAADGAGGGGGAARARGGAAVRTADVAFGIALRADFGGGRVVDGLSATCGVLGSSGDGSGDDGAAGALRVFAALPSLPAPPWLARGMAVDYVAVRATPRRAPPRCPLAPWGAWGACSGCTGEGGGGDRAGGAGRQERLRQAAAVAAARAEGGAGACVPRKAVAVVQRRVCSSRAALACLAAAVAAAEAAVAAVAAAAKGRAKAHAGAGLAGQAGGSRGGSGLNGGGGSSTSASFLLFAVLALAAVAIVPRRGAGQEQWPEHGNAIGGGNEITMVALSARTRRAPADAATAMVTAAAAGEREGEGAVVQRFYS